MRTLRQLGLKFHGLDFGMAIAALGNFGHPHANADTLDSFGATELLGCLVMAHHDLKMHQDGTPEDYARITRMTDTIRTAIHSNRNG